MGSRIRAQSLIRMFFRKLTSSSPVPLQHVGFDHVDPFELGEDHVHGEAGDEADRWQSGQKEAAQREFKQACDLLDKKMPKVERSQRFGDDTKL
jgi:hypothetical protein